MNMERKVKWSAQVADLQELEALAPELASMLPRTGVVAIHGPMGAGKTTWVSALCRIWGVETGGSSPTFALVNLYERPGLADVAHWDLYRIASEEEAWDAGVLDSFSRPILNLVEWPERAPGLLPEDSWLLRISWLENSRTVSLEAPMLTAS